jgi:hydroxyacylglutathione hydrolase
MFKSASLDLATKRVAREPPATIERVRPARHDRVRAIRVKRVLKWLAAIVAVLAIVAAALWYSVFGNNSPIVDGDIAPGVETVKDGFVSIAVIDVGAGKVALVDAGRDAAGKAILTALGRRGLTQASVAAIFLTHGHPDHTAACKLFPDAQIYAMESDVGLVGDAARVTHPLHDADPLHKGEQVDVGDQHIEAFSVPGHTPGSAVYLARGVLFFGDSAGAAKDGSMKKAVRLLSNSGQNIRSLAALETRLLPRAADIKVLAFAHTGPLAGFEPFVAWKAREEMGDAP